MELDYRVFDSFQASQVQGGPSCGCSCLCGSHHSQRQLTEKNLHYVPSWPEASFRRSQVGYFDSMYFFDIIGPSSDPRNIW